MKRLLFSLLLPGCAHAAPPEEREYDTVYLYLLDAQQVDHEAPPSEEARAIIREAGDILGVEIELTPYRWGSVVVDLVSTEDLVEGRAIQRWGCERWIRSSRSARVLAHELGHVYGLPHYEAYDNVMHPTVLGNKMTEFQTFVFRMNLKAHRLCYGL